MGYKLLVTDDNTYVTEVLEKRLTKEGFEVVVASDGEDALQKLDKENPDIILLDLMMPKKNGFEVLKEIRRRKEEDMDIWRPVIIISSKEESEAMAVGYNRLEADMYLNKPCSLETILEAVKKMVRKLDRTPRQTTRIQTPDGERLI